MREEKRPVTEDEPQLSASVPSRVWLARIDITRSNIDEAWQQIRARIPDVDLSNEVGRRPSLLNIPVRLKQGELMCS